MENEETRLQALRVLNEYFKYEGNFGCLTDRQVKLVLDAMIDFRQFCVLTDSNKLGQLPLDNDKAWNTHDVIAKLIEATDILLHRKDYDGHGWEEIEICYQRGKEILQQIKR